MFLEYRGRRLVLRLSAAREIDELGLDVGQVLEVLENGFDCSSGGARKPGIEEKCLKTREKVVRVVVAEGMDSYPEGGREEVFYVVHVSRETYKKERRWQ